jgi:hypothetical protein
MYTTVPGPKYKCSKCGSIDRFFVRFAHYSQTYKECADCGHDNKPPPPLDLWKSYASSDAPKIVEY